MAYDDRELRRRLHQAAEVIVVPDRPLRRRSRALPILAGAAATAVVLVLAVAVGQYLNRRDQPGGVATSPTATATTSATPSSSPTATPSVSPSATTASFTNTPIPLPAPAQVSAPSRDVVWAFVGGSVLFRSMDRGTTWEQRPLPSGLVNAEISFVNDREGWISSVGSPATQCQSQSITLWHTSDGGANWARLAMTGIADTQCKSQLSFTDAQHGYIVAATPANPAIIYHSSDGGRTWSPSSRLPDPPGVTTVPGQPNLEPTRVRSFGATLLVPVAGPSQGVSAAGYVYKSTDGGATWAYAATAPELGGQLPALATETRWLQLGIPGPSHETTDGGKTWHNYTSEYAQAAPIGPEMVFADANVAYATIPTRGSIQRTVDGGAHWAAIRTPGTG